MTLYKTDGPRPIDRVIGYFGEPRPVLAAASTPPPAPGRKPAA